MTRPFPKPRPIPMPWWKPVVISGVVFALCYAVSHDYFFSGVNGFGAFYIVYYLEKKAEQKRANLEVGA
jgi:hypothetical protein